MTNNHSFHYSYPSRHLVPYTHAHTQTHALLYSIESFLLVKGRAPEIRARSFISLLFFPPRYTLSGRISSSFLFLQRTSSSRLFFIEFLPTTAARRDYLWPLETIEERCKHTRIHFRIHPPPPSKKRLGGRYEGGHQFIEADRSSRRRWGQDATLYISIHTVDS